MKKKKSSENLRRASEVITCDRIGVSSGIETFLNRELYLTLSDFFTISDEIKTKITPTASGFEITVKTTAKSVKQFKNV